MDYMLAQPQRSMEVEMMKTTIEHDMVGKAFLQGTDQEANDD